MFQGGCLDFVASFLMLGRYLYRQIPIELYAPKYNSRHGRNQTGTMEAAETPCNSYCHSFLMIPATSLHIIHSRKKTSKKTKVVF